MGSWKLGVEPEGFEVERRESEFAVLMMMAGDGDLARELQPDIDEMLKGAAGEIGVLALVDTPGETGVRVVEIRSDGFYELEGWPEISTGDPRPLADFLARGLVSFSKETRFAIGFWGHGSGVFGDYDTQERVIDREFRFGPLGEPIPAEAAFKVVLEPKVVLSRSMMPDMTSENSLTNREASSALAVAFSRAKRTRKVDMVFFDTCLNGSVEVFTEVRPFAEAVVASALPVPGGGWNYGYWLRATRQQLPKDAKAWAYIAAGAYGAAYDQRTYPQPAQMAAFATDGVFVEAFANLVRALKQRGEEGAKLIGAAGRMAESVYYGENLDLMQLVRAVKTLSKDEELLGLAFEVSRCYSEAVVGISMAPVRGENLSGMTVWCPISGDREGVTPYYRNLEFDRLTGWMDLLQTGAKPPEPQRMSYGMYGFWGLELVEEAAVESFTVSMDPGEKTFSLAIPEECVELVGDLVEGRYRFHGGAGSIHFPSYVVVRELYRQLTVLRDCDEDFSALEGAAQSGWVLGTEACAKLVKDFEKYEKRYESGDRDELMLYTQMKRALQKVSKDGLMVFG